MGITALENLSFRAHHKDSVATADGSKIDYDVRIGLILIRWRQKEVWHVKI
jgi:hypothetical protein